MSYAEGSHPDAPILDQIRGLTGSITDERSRAILRSVVDAVALNPQPLPPLVNQVWQEVVSELNPQPLPPGPPPESA
jgi:hypothetical protein